MAIAPAAALESRMAALTIASPPTTIQQAIDDAIHHLFNHSIRDVLGFVRHMSGTSSTQKVTKVKALEATRAQWLADEMQPKLVQLVALVKSETAAKVHSHSPLQLSIYGEQPPLSTLVAAYAVDEKEYPADFADAFINRFKTLFAKHSPEGKKAYHAEIMHFRQKACPFGEIMQQLAAELTLTDLYTSHLSRMDYDTFRFLS